MREHIKIRILVFQMLFHPHRMVKNKVKFRSVNRLVQIVNLILHLHGKQITLHADNCLKVPVAVLQKLL